MYRLQLVNYWVDMTLPIQPICEDKASLPLRAGVGKRRPACLSAAWADPPITRKERRRAIYSWSVGYGTLTEFEESSIISDYTSLNKGKFLKNKCLFVHADFSISVIVYWNWVTVSWTKPHSHVVSDNKFP